MLLLGGRQRAADHHPLEHGQHGCAPDRCSSQTRALRHGLADARLRPVSTAALTTFLIGLRHGLDWDHLAAITDLSGSGLDRRRGTALALVYAAGHGATVLALGVLAVAAGTRLPDWIDPVMRRVVGVTLLVLAVGLLLR